MPIREALSQSCDQRCREDAAHDAHFRRSVWWVFGAFLAILVGAGVFVEFARFYLWFHR